MRASTSTAPLGKRLNVKRVLVIYKKSTLELYSEDYRDPAFLAHVQTDSDLIAPYVAAHEDNQRTMAAVRSALDQRKVHQDWVYRARKRSTEGYDLVITIGGDGTLLDASHAVVNVPVLGINSSPRFSVGHFCGCNAESFSDAIDRILARTMPQIALRRLEARIEGRTLPYPILNDVLFSHHIPAAMSRYIVRANGTSDEHKSSGLWIATAAGSTAAIHSAGGQVMPLESTAVQLLARELYVHNHDEHPLAHAFTDGPIELVSKMRVGALYMDGHRIKFNVAYGERVVLSPSPNPLRLFWDPVAARDRLPSLRR